MNKLLTAALGRRSIEVSCAWALAELPGAVQLLKLAETPAQDAFLAFVKTLRSSDPRLPTRCAGWTVHELTAHLTAGSAEIADLVELEISGAPPRPTRDFEEREAPYRALAPKKLRRELFRQALRASIAIERLSRAGRGRRVTFTGALLDAPALVLHSESELVLHRWDIVGNDGVSVRALSDPRFAAHAATTVAAMRPNVFPPRAGERKTIILRSPGTTDIAVTGGSITTIRPAPQDAAHPIVECHPATRTVLLWGRHPGPGLPEPAGDSEALAAVTAMLRPDPARRTRSWGPTISGGQRPPGLPGDAGHRVRQV
ncbi:maleylpyruvate isomerase N-terminal domain-containing protein [Mycobacterium paraffinicum]|uniref:maleylpyruvate isomerase N-terminal domain-containing protein n=1 Tax=Mycobacterium paraffinicum TaxID=53378 RepID=UPI003CD0619D